MKRRTGLGLGMAALAVALFAFGTARTAFGASSLDEALDLCRRTYDYVAKSIPEKEAPRAHIPS